MNNVTVINSDAPADSGVTVFEIEKHYIKSVLIPASRSVNIELSASHWVREYKHETSLCTALVIEVGPVRMQTNLSASQARELAAAMIEFADELDAHQAQFALSEAQAEPQAELKTANGKP